MGWSSLVTFSVIFYLFETTKTLKSGAGERN